MATTQALGEGGTIPTDSKVICTLRVMQCGFWVHPDSLTMGNSSPADLA